MQNDAAILAIALMLASATSVMAENPAETGSPGSDKTPGPNDAKAQPNDAHANDTKNTGAMDPDTPDPTKNTPGAETKN